MTAGDRSNGPRASSDGETTHDRPLLITGATGTLGRAFARLCEVRRVPHRLVTRQQMDLASPPAIAAMLAETAPWAVINAAGFVRVDDAETATAACVRDNTLAAENLARACAARAVELVTFSTDMVFDGGKSAPYVESDPTGPRNTYGRSKLAAERAVLAALPRALVIRTSAFFGPRDPHNFAVQVLQKLHAGRPCRAADDLVVSPTYVPDLVHATLELLRDGTRGVRHLSNDGALSWAELARRVAAVAGLSASGVEAVPHARLGLAAVRPRYSALGSERGSMLPALDGALTRWFVELDPRAYRL